MQTLWQDVRFGVRNLRKSPGFTAVAILTLALGIGASTVGFSVFYNLVFNAFAAKNASRLAVPMLEAADFSAVSGLNLDIFACSLSDFDAIRTAFEDIACSGHALALIDDGKEIRQLRATYVTANAFEFYGVPALLGRGIAPEDGKPGAPPVFVMSYKTWVGEFGLNPEILGKSFTVNGEVRTLIGIMPPRFQAYGALTSIWTPINVHDPATPTINLYILARLRRGETLDAASAQMNVIARQLAKADPKAFPKHFTVRVQSAADFLMGPWGIGSAGGSQFGLKKMIYALLAGVIMLLLIACMNVGNLLLARATVRGQEIAVRAALGATRSRLIRQLLAESLLLAGAAFAVGCALAYFGLKGAAVVLPQKGIAIGGESVIGLDRAALFFAFSVSLASTLACGLTPAIHAVGRDLQSRLTGGAKSVGGQARHGRLRSALVSAEVALSIVLLIGAGLLVRSFFILTQVDLGFNPQNLIFAAFEQASWQHENSKNNGTQRFRDEVFRRLKMLPGVADAAVNNSLLGYNTGRRGEVTVPGATRFGEAGFDGCSENLLSLLGLHLLLGRWLSEGNIASAQRVAVINQTMARDFFGDADPVGREIQVKEPGQTNTAVNGAFRVVGVVRDTKDYNGPEQPVRSMAYIPYTLEGYAFFLIKTKAAPASMIPAIQEQVWAVDPNVFEDLEPVDDILYGLTYSGPEFVASAVSPLASVALLLVVAGVLGVVAYTVSLQTHEIGILMTLGAQPENILGMVLWRGMRLVATGIVLGVFASLELTKFIASQIWGVSATDPMTFVGVATLLTLVALAACYVPARRAMRIDPMVALRYE